MENLLVEDILRDYVDFWESHLNHLGDQVSFTLSILNGSGIQVDNAYQKIGKVYARKEWLRKLDDIIIFGASSTDLVAALTPINEGAEHDRLLMAKAYFKINAKLNGEIDFIREYCGAVTMKEFMIIQYNIDYLGDRHRLCEITADWDGGVKLVAMSVLDFERGPKAFIRERILKFK